MKSIRSTARSLVFGAPISSRQAKTGNLPKRRAFPLFGADGVSSVAYAPDEIILTLLIAGQTALQYSPWVGVSIAVMLLLVIGTYRYNIQHVGEHGDFALVYKNLGARYAVLLGAAMMVDFMLTVSVSLASATQYLESLAPGLHQHQRLTVCIMIALVTFLCLRGVKFMFRVAHYPTYIFLALLGGTLVCGLIADAAGTLGQAGSAGYEVAQSASPAGLATDLGLMVLMLRVFASGSVALTGVNTISNSTRAFAPPRQGNAAFTLMVMGGIASALLLTVLYLTWRTGAVFVLDPAENLIIDGQPAPADLYQTPVLLQISEAIFPFTWVTVLLGAATICILVVASMTAFTGFPLLVTALAQRQYLPIYLSARSSASLYANGVLLLGLVSMVLTALVGPDVHALVQMYIVGVFTSFLLTQIAVFRSRWRIQRLTLNLKQRRTIWRDVCITAVGVLASGTILLVVLLTKFTHGAWVSTLLILLLAGFMMKINKHYRRIDRELALPETEKDLAEARALPSRVHALIYVERVRKPALRALSYARASRPSSIEAVLVNLDEGHTQANIDAWQKLGLPVDLTVLDAPYRNPQEALLEYVHRRRQKSPHDVLVVYLPEYVLTSRWQRIFHRRTVHRLKTALKYEPGVVVASVPWAIGGKG
ncbi:MAG: APC family permease [Rothia sp. (in: high G+C Gram-positive bacteria)]|nr:APC family permease [Rothia sp. (in: high G+C Gram-positive bacteria)]